MKRLFLVALIFPVLVACGGSPNSRPATTANAVCADKVMTAKSSTATVEGAYSCLGREMQVRQRILGVSSDAAMRSSVDVKFKRCPADLLGLAGTFYAQGYLLDVNGTQALIIIWIDAAQSSKVVAWNFYTDQLATCDAVPGIVQQVGA